MDAKNIDAIPLALRDSPQWVCRLGKVPLRADGLGKASSTDPGTWCSFPTAIAAQLPAMDGVGYALCEGITCLDLDGVIGVDRSWSAWATELVILADSYAEFSPSRLGVHIWLTGRLPAGLRTRFDWPDSSWGSLEAYCAKRYMTVTGDCCHSSGVIRPISPDLEAYLVSKLGAAPQGVPPKPSIIVPAAVRAVVGGSKYGTKALDNECAIVRTAPRGTRNSTLNIAALKIGHLIAGGECSEAEACTALAAAAASAGLDEAETLSTIRSGMRAGMREPRSAPQLVNVGTGHYTPQRAAPTELIEELRLYTPEELMCMPQAPMIIDGVLRSGEVGLFIGATKTRKTWCMLDLALSMARGSPWMGGISTSAGNVLLVDAESSLPSLGERIRLLSIDRGGVDTHQIRILPARGAGGGADIMPQIAAGIGKISAGLCIIDTLSATLPAQDENDNAEATRIMGDVVALADETGCAIMLVHHTAKGGGAGRSVVDSGAGASAYARRADAIISVRDEDGHTMCDILSRSCACRSRSMITFGPTMRPQIMPTEAAGI